MATNLSTETSGELRKQYAVAIAKKFADLRQLVESLPLRTNPRPPDKLKFLAACFTEFSVGLNDSQTPRGCIGLRIIGKAVVLDDLIHEPLDKLARTFVALEQFEQWLRRVSDGEQRHQAEMERQASHKMVRIETYIALKGKTQ